MTTTVRPRTRTIRALLQRDGYAPTARELGTSAGYLHDLAHGRRNGSPEMLERLAGALGVTLEDIADVDGESLS